MKKSKKSKNKPENRTYSVGGLKLKQLTLELKEVLKKSPNRLEKHY